MNSIFLIFLSILIIFPFSFSSGLVNSCADDPNSPGQWNLTTNLTFTIPTCISFSSPDVLLDCNGYSIIGNLSAYAIYLNELNVSVINCNLINTSIGIYVDIDGHFSEISNNLFLDNLRGIYIGYNYNGTLNNNDFINNTRSIWMESTDNNEIYNNQFRGSLESDLYLSSSSSSNIFYLNNFENSSLLLGTGYNLNSFNTTSQGNYYGDFNNTLPFCFGSPSVCDNFAALKQITSSSSSSITKIFPFSSFVFFISILIIFIN